MLFLFCITQLCGCNFIKQKAPQNDGKFYTVIDAAQKSRSAVTLSHQALSRSSKNAYVMHGRRYHVLQNSQGYHQEGTASWYGAQFHGRLTANSEHYNLNGMTAASPILPLPTYIKVTNLENGQQVVVKVNDRGPFRDNRILDLSYAAAKKLGFAKKGLAQVAIDVIDDNIQPGFTGNNYYAKSNELNIDALGIKQLNNSSIIATNNYVPRSTPETTNIYLQINNMKNLAYAQQISTKANRLTNLPAYITNERSANRRLYRVKIGPFASTAHIQFTKKLLEEHNVKSMIIINKQTAIG